MRVGATAAPPTGDAWVTPDLSTWAEVSGANYTHAGSTWGSGSGTMRLTATHGYPDSGLDAGGIQSGDLGLTVGDVRAIVCELTFSSDFPTDEAGRRGLVVALVDGATLSADEGVYGGLERTAAGNYTLSCGVVGNTTITRDANDTSRPGVVVVTFPFDSDGPVGVAVSGKGGGRRYSTSDAQNEPNATSAVHMMLLGMRETTGTGTLDIVLTGFRYKVVSA